MSDIEERVKVLLEKRQEIEKELVKNEASLGVSVDRLKNEYGVESVEDAQTRAAQLREKVVTLRERLEDMVERVEALIANKD